MFWRAWSAAVLAAVFAFGAALWIGESPAAAEGAQDGAIAGTPARPVPQTALDAFMRSANALYDAAVKADAAGVRRYARETETWLRALPMNRIASAEGIEALAGSVSRVKRAAAAAQADPDKWRSLAAEIRLAADALVHPDKPLWLRYQPVIRADIDAIAQALTPSGAQTAANEQLASLQAHYALIRTAALLRSEPYVIERADSALRYASRVLGAKEPDPRMLPGVPTALREALEGVFPGRSAAKTAVIVPAASPSWGWPAFMGTFIVSMLTWAGWQRYKRPAPLIPPGSLPPGRRERH